MRRIGDRQRAGQDDVRRRILGALADGLLEQRLRFGGDGEAVLAVVLLGDAAQELLGALEEAGGGAGRRGDEERRGERSGAASASASGATRRRRAERSGIGRGRTRQVYAVD